MKFTSGVEQATCVLVLLATQATDHPLASDEISRILDVSPSYLKKLIRKLVVHNIIKSVPGTNGGISLGMNIDDISVLQLIEAVDGPIQIYHDHGLIVRAFHGGPHAKQGADIVQQMFDGASSLLHEYFSSITCADLLKRSISRAEIPKLDWRTMSIEQVIEFWKTQEDV